MRIWIYVSVLAAAGFLLAAVVTVLMSDRRKPKS